MARDFAGLHLATTAGCILLIGGSCLTATAQHSDSILREGFDLQKCGVPRVAIVRNRITEGDLALEGHWPWHGGLFYLDDYQCGCTLINELFVLTASHCVYNGDTGCKVSERILRVKLGMQSLSANASAQIQLYMVRSIISHSKFVPDSHKHDVALLRLNGSVQFTDYIQPVCLDLTESIWVEYLADVYGTVVGWGITEKNRISDQLLKVEIPIVRYTDCVESNPDLYGRLIYSGMYCAGILNGTSPCNGDSGGGMYIFREKRWFLRGVVSFAGIREGTNYCDSFSYVVFMNVPYYTKWIATEVDAARESLRMQEESSLKSNISSRWTRNALTATTGTVLSASGWTYRAFLTFHEVHHYHAGEYWCQVTGKMGLLYESGLLLEVSNVPVRFQQNGGNKSYAVYDAPYGGVGRSSSQFSFEMTFKTQEPDGLLFLKPSISDVESWSFSLYLDRFRFTFRVVPPSQTEKVFRSVRLSLVPSRWYTVLISCFDGQGFLALDGQYLVGFEGHLLLHRLDRYYIANAPQLNTAGFSGCVSRLMVNEKKLHLERDLSERLHVEWCNDCASEECTEDGSSCPLEQQQNSCINDVCSEGRCGHTDYMLAPARACDLQSGTYTGGLRFQHTSYASYRSFLLVALTVDLQFRLHSLQDGIVLHTAKHWRGYGKFITVLLKAGRIELRFTTDAHLNAIYMESSILLRTDRWHRLKAAYEDDYVFLQVDDEQKVARSVYGETLFQTDQQLIVFVGGVRWRGFINRHRDVKQGLDGCIKEVIEVQHPATYRKMLTNSVVSRGSYVTRQL